MPSCCCFAQGVGSNFSFTIVAEVGHIPKVTDVENPRSQPIPVHRRGGSDGLSAAGAGAGIADGSSTSGTGAFGRAATGAAAVCSQMRAPHKPRSVIVCAKRPLELLVADDCSLIHRCACVCACVCVCLCMCEHACVCVRVYVSICVR